MKAAIFKEGDYYTVRYKCFPFFFEWWYYDLATTQIDAEYKLKECLIYRGKRITDVRIKIKELRE